MTVVETKAQRAEALLLTHPGWANARIGREAGCSSTRVGDVRRWLEAEDRLTADARRAYRATRLDTEAAALPRAGAFFPRQLSLLTYAEAYSEAKQRACRAVLEGEIDDPEPAQPPGDAPDSVWDMYEWRCQLREQRHASRWDGIEIAARKDAERAALYEGVPSWSKLRALVWHRDQGICWGCGDVVPFDELQLGHLIDRVEGGPDLPENLAVMCERCNMTTKPLHRTIAEAEAWRARGGWRGTFREWATEYVAALRAAGLGGWVDHAPKSARQTKEKLPAANSASAS